MREALTMCMWLPSARICMPLRPPAPLLAMVAPTSTAADASSLESSSPQLRHTGSIDSSRLQN